MPRRVLWAVGYQAEKFKPGAVVSERYLCKASQIFLDLKPGLPPGTLTDIPFTVLPYLRLTAHRLHLPQVYGWTDGTLASGETTRLMFLENSALSPPTTDGKIEPSILPPLKDMWSSGSALQQLHWLWQIAHLWQPLATEHIASTLLDLDLVRVEASLIRLIQLHVPQFHTPQSAESAPQPRFPQLGQCWQELLKGARPEVQPFIEQICQKLIEGYFQDGQALVTALDLGLQSVTQAHTIFLGTATQTDKGPSRANNQDACFPASGNVGQLTLTPGSNVNPGVTKPLPAPLIVVCDGIGGHQGGEIASATAIEEITDTLQPLELLSDAEGFNPWFIHDRINVAIAQANDAINQRNDSEKRRERARMGTTVVMGLIHNHECFISHVGDSRVYWITHAGCHQITLDDDVASREARLGYGTYRSVLYHPNAGALVQALGMGPSKNLYPSGQRLILGEEGILLFCSDGLSDQDLIETSWSSILTPLLHLSKTSADKERKKVLGHVVNNLVELANTRNGHDNVTIGLVQWHSRQVDTIQIPDLDVLIHAYNSQAERNLSAMGEQGSDNSQDDDDPPTQPPGTTTLSLTQLLATTSPNIEDVRGQEKRTAFSNAVLQDASSPLIADSPELGTSPSPASIPSEELAGSNSPRNGEAWISPSATRAESRKSPFLAGITVFMGLLLFLILGGGAVYLTIPEVSDRINAALGINSGTAAPDNSPVPLPPFSQGAEDSDERLNRPDSSQSTSISDGVDNSVGDNDEALTIGNVLNLRRTPPTLRTLDAAAVEGQGNLEAENAVLLLFEQPPEAGIMGGFTVQHESSSVDPKPQIDDSPGNEQVVDDSADNSAELVINPAITPIGVVPWGSILQVQETFELSYANSSALSYEEDVTIVSQPNESNTRNDVNLEGNGQAEVDNLSESSEDRVGERWVKVQLCSTPSNTIALPSTETGTSILAVGRVGWILERQLKELSYLDRDQASPFNEHCASEP
ncbi:MAG: protein phosphatase 2C domain-containing protein [Cyanobacteria bacterium P01_F01_bin.150]